MGSMPAVITVADIARPPVPSVINVYDRAVSALIVFALASHICSKQYSWSLATMVHVPTCSVSVARRPAIQGK